MPTQTRRRSGKTLVLQAAITLFTRVGYHGTSMRDIAAEADVTVASIYYHFKSKQEILQQIMVGILTDVIGQTRSAVLASGGSAQAQLVALVRAWILFHTQRQQEALIGASEIRSLDDEGRRLVVTLRDEQEALFREVIKRGTDAGEFATPYPREAARAIINMGYSIAAWYRAGGELSPEELAERYTELALGLVRGGTPTTE